MRLCYRLIFNYIINITLFYVITFMRNFNFNIIVWFDFGAMSSGV